MKPKQIILDKSAFVGINLNALCEFAEHHFLILPSVLHDECVTNEYQAAELRERYERIILAGGFFCPSILAGACGGILEHFRSSPIDDRVSNEWMTWHHLRVILVMHLENRFLGELRPVSKVEHDLQDMEYVSLLSRADAILTREREKKGYMAHLARAAFPEKDVFSSLDEVPEPYRCDGVNGGRMPRHIAES